MIDLRSAIVLFLALVISLTIHEFAHAWMANRLGDPTPRQAGRLTLNPMVLFRAHPFGALIVPLMAALQGFLIGWAATPVNPSRVRRSVTLRKAEFLISFAGPVSNVLLGLLSGVVYAILIRTGTPALEPMIQLTRAMVFANVILAVLNMIPIPPLDGFTVLRTAIPTSPAIGFLTQYGTIILIIFFIYGQHLFSPFLRLAGSFLGMLEP
ncbi:MAG: site-2 protease family protein [Myxococcota bacterium]|nr:site-2 protease family protein [Myxococcota bacterium]